MRRLGRWRRILLLGTPLVLGACESLQPSTRFVHGLSAEERARAATIPLYSSASGTASHETLGPVEGLSCQITFDEGYSVSEENARQELRRAAFRAGGDAVIEVACEAFGRHQGPRACFRSVLCTGVAVRLPPD